MDIHRVGYLCVDQNPLTLIIRALQIRYINIVFDLVDKWLSLNRKKVKKFSIPRFGILF